MNGGVEFLSWVIEARDTDFSPTDCAKWLEGRLPRPVDDLKNWDLDDPVEWYPEHLRCSDFLVVMIHWQAVMGGFGQTWSAAVDLSFSEKLQSWNVLGSINELRAYTRDGVALCWLPWTDGARVFVAGADHARVDALASEFDVEWDGDYR